MEPQGKMTFFCPYCRQKLSFLDGTVIKMLGRLHCETFSCKAMFYVPAQLGQHGAIVGEGVRIHEGAKVELECINPTCKKNFTTDYNPELAEVVMADAAGKEYKVVFNKVYGKNSTFVLDMKERKVVGTYGDTNEIFDDISERRRNFFGE